MKKASREPEPGIICAYDIETVNWTRVVGVCAECEDGRTFRGTSVAEFVRWVVNENMATPSYQWHAHFGGIFDHRFVIHELLPEWEISDAFANSGAGIWHCDLRDGNGRVLCLRSSDRIMPSSLASIGDAIGLPKLDVDRGAIGELSRDEMLDYCARDVAIVVKGLQFARSWFAGLGVQMRETLAATTTAHVRAHNVPEDAWGWDRGTDDEVAAAYYGGRVEVFRHELNRARWFDVASSYPAAMAAPLPTRLVAHGRGMAPRRPGTLTIYRAHVTVSQGVGIGPLPYRPQSGPLRGRLCFPSGSWEGMFCDEELDAARSLFGAVWEPLEHWTYRAEPFMRPLMLELYQRKATATNPFERYMAKIALNANSGKFIESPEREVCTMSYDRARKASDAIRTLSVKTRRGWCQVFFAPIDRPGGFRHSAAAAYVTARGRIKLLNGFAELQRQGSQIGYCDTDSIVTSGELPTGTEMGAWTDEGSFARCEFAAPKLYAAWDDTGRFVKLKAKGFKMTGDDAAMVSAGWWTVPNSRDRAIENQRAALWQAIRDGETWNAETFRGWGESLRAGTTEYVRKTRPRRNDPGTTPKRHPSGRPWSVSEIESLK